MKVVVTGASGHVGANLVRALLAEGREVRAVVHQDARALEGLELEFFEADVRDAEAIDKAIEGAEVVYHLAARISITGGQGGLVDAINVGGVANVVDACLKHEVRLLHTSSVHAFEQRPKDQPIDEQRPLAHQGKCPAYDRSKALGELEVRKGLERGLDAVILNPGAVLGPHDYKPSRMGDLLYTLYHGRMPALVGGGFSWVDVRDVVQGMLAAERKGRSGEKYILTGEYCSVKDLSVLVGEITGRKMPAFSSPLWLAHIGAPFVEFFSKMFKAQPLFTSEALHTLGGNSDFDYSKAQKELGFEPRPLRDTLTDTYAWFDEMGWLKKGHRHD